MSLKESYRTPLGSYSHHSAGSIPITAPGRPERSSMLRRVGLQKTTLLDYPGEVAATVFTRGCNLRCPYCHNPSLVPMPPSPEKEELRDSVEVLRRFEVDYELRTTVAPGIVGPQDMASILPLLPGARRYQLKAFRGGTVLDPSYADTIPPSEANMEEMRSIAAESGVPCE